jgi:hypothetical protein
MTYTITSDILVVGKKRKGETITEKELLDANCNIEALIEAKHVTPSNVQAKPEVEKGADE